MNSRSRVALLAGILLAAAPAGAQYGGAGVGTGQSDGSETSGNGSQGSGGGALASPSSTTPAPVSARPAAAGGGSASVRSSAACASNEPCASNPVLLPPDFRIEPLYVDGYALVIQGKNAQPCATFDFCYDIYAPFAGGNFVGEWANIGAHQARVASMAFTVPTPGQMALNKDGTPLTFQTKNFGPVRYVAADRIQYELDFDLAEGGDIASISAAMVTISKMPGDMGFSGNIPEVCSNHAVERTKGVAGDRGPEMIKNYPMEGWWDAAGITLSSDGVDPGNANRAVCLIRPGQTYYLNLMVPDFTTDPTKNGVLGYRYIPPDDTFQLKHANWQAQGGLAGAVSVFYGGKNSYMVDATGKKVP